MSESKAPSSSSDPAEKTTYRPTPETASVVIFGASGDLTARKLLPALFDLWHDGFLCDRSPIIGVARREKTDEVFRNEIFEAMGGQFRGGEITPEQWARFSNRLFYRQLDISVSDGYAQFKQQLEEIEQQQGTGSNRIVYMATSPDLFLPAVEHLGAAEMIPGRDDENWLRVVFEKPFGHDLASSQELSGNLRRLLREQQIFRIDHYLGKETVQNILLFRFGNSIFEPLLNRNHVDHIQITVAESQGLERGRGGYYDNSGALRDVLQNHVLQLLCLIAMEPPALFNSDDLHEEKLKVIKALSPGNPGDISNWVVSGQYSAGTVDGKSAISYLSEERIPQDSRTETYVAMKVQVDNWRWAGVPFYLRTGKRLPARVSEIAIQFKHPPLNLFNTVECDGDMCALVGAKPNKLVFRIQPSESIKLSFSTKRPGMQYQIHPVTMDFDYKTFTQPLPEAYERLLLDVLRGDSTLFMRSDELEAAWKFVTPILDYWNQHKIVPEPYRSGTWGPRAADQLLQSEGHNWRSPTK
ncbi:MULTISPECIES: glucose-6-phosphate dehydrogenase [unclassified Schlesneria]|uniref:glucose-6-phosphate dehydrogenase n=1 Tax=Schlesneria TaxID=656899 RepID=UPI002EFF6F06